jgi:hypothetical protein
MTETREIFVVIQGQGRHCEHPIQTGQPCPKCEVNVEDLSGTWSGPKETPR